MPIIRSAKKALRQSKKRHLQNLFYKNRIRRIKKELEKAIQEKKTEEVKELLKQFYKAVDKAAKEKVIHKNKAARLKSRWTKKVDSFHPAKSC